VLMRTDPLRELDRLSQRVLGTVAGPSAPPTAMPMDAYRSGDAFVVVLDLPGVTPESIDLELDRDVLTVKAERRPAVTGDGVEMQIAERPSGSFSRRLFLGDALDTSRIAAHYDAGVLTLRIPVVEQARPRRIAVTANGARDEITV
jgi:HSP20 family protein